MVRLFVGPFGMLWHWLEGLRGYVQVAVLAVIVLLLAPVVVVLLVLVIKAIIAAFALSVSISKAIASLSALQFLLVLGGVAALALLVWAMRRFEPLIQDAGENGPEDTDGAGATVVFILLMVGFMGGLAASNLRHNDRPPTTTAQPAIAGAQAASTQAPPMVAPSPTATATALPAPSAAVTPEPTQTAVVVTSPPTETPIVAPTATPTSP